MLSQEDIQQFIKLYKKEFGINLSFEEANLYALDLINLVELVATNQNK